MYKTLDRLYFELEDFRTLVNLRFVESEIYHDVLDIISDIFLKMTPSDVRRMYKGNVFEMKSSYLFNDVLNISRKHLPITKVQSISDLFIFYDILSKIFSSFFNDLKKEVLKVKGIIFLDRERSENYPKLFQLYMQHPESLN